jgi:multicomponent Na+:H+ antiporter subunit E
VISLIWLFLYELVLSAVRVAKIAMQPKLNIRPGFFIYELKTDRDAEITLLANLITLTPGTLSVDVSDDKKRLFIHAIDIDDIEAMRVDIEQGFERKIMEALR